MMKGMIHYDIGAMQGEKLLRMNMIISFIHKGWESGYSMMSQVKQKQCYGTDVTDLLRLVTLVDSE